MNQFLRYIAIAGITMYAMFLIIASYYLQLPVGELYRPLLLFLFVSSACGIALSIIVLIRASHWRRRSRSSEEFMRLLEMKENGSLSEEEFVQKVKQTLIFTKRN